MNKRGMSAIVTTLIIIVLVIVAIGILWVVVKNVIIKQSELIEKKKQFFNEGVEIMSVKLNDSLVSINLRKIGGETETITEGEEEVQESIETDVVSVIDLSGSMRACHEVSSWSCCYFTLEGDYQSGNCYGITLDKETNCTPSCNGIKIDRLTPSQDANKELVDILFETENSRMGLVGYSSDIKETACLDLTDNLESVNNKIDSWEAQGGTCLCCGINEAITKLEQQSSEEKVKTIIVMSDGDANMECSEQGTGDAGQDAIQAACDANNTLTNLTIYTVGVGDTVDETTLESIAECGNGEYFSAINVSDLTQIYQTVAEKITVTQKSTHNFNNLLFVFYNKTDSYKETTSEIPEILGTENYNFNLTGKLEGELQKIKIYPLIITTSGKEIIGPLLDTWERN